MNITDFLIGAIVLLVLYIYCVFKKAYSYFDQNDIPYVKPTFIFGNVMDWILMRKALPVIHFELYEQLKPHRFGGTFMALKKSILIRDPDLVRNVLTKDFVHFYDRGTRRDPHVDKLSQNLFSMTGNFFYCLHYLTLATTRHQVFIKLFHSRRGMEKSQN